MDEDGIGLVLARAAELRLKINKCIHKASSSPDKQEKEEGVVANGEEEEEDYCEESERLLGIHQALESLEAQLSNLQVCDKMKNTHVFKLMFYVNSIVNQFS